MLDSLLTNFKELVLNFTLRRLFYTLILILIVLIVISAFEWYTASFQLNKLEKITKIISEIQSIKSNIKSNDAEIMNICSEMTTQLQREVKLKTFSLRYGSLLIRFLIGLFPWILFSLIYIPSIKRKEQNAFSGMYATLFFGVIIGAIAIFSPIINFWLNCLISLIMFFAIVLFITFIMKRKDSKKLISK
ncbi:MAG: hypothetical protein NTX89_02055 [Candidatus Omnitrophica bacterium]|nr:hypothetical protein [Candidatus Omnitrophota bacterium]